MLGSTIRIPDRMSSSDSQKVWTLILWAGRYEAVVPALGLQTSLRTFHRELQVISEENYLVPASYIICPKHKVFYRLFLTASHHIGVCDSNLN